jgi:hypothetical protein
VTSSWVAGNLLLDPKGHHLLLLFEPHHKEAAHRIVLSPPKAEYSRSAVIEHHAGVITVVAQVRAQVLGYSRVDGVIHTRGGGSVFDIDKDYDHLSNVEISEMLSLDDDHQD